MSDATGDSAKSDGPKAPLLAIDFDDVLAATNQTIADWHNKYYGTNMKLSDFHYYHYWKNPGWGNVHETLSKVSKFYASEEFANIPVIDGAMDGIQQLKAMGFRLSVVTARGPQMQALSEAFLNKYFADCFDEVHYVGFAAKKHLDNTGADVKGHTKGKPEVLEETGAVALVDDSIENALGVTIYEPYVIPVLLFGKYEWNRRHSPSYDQSEDMRDSEKDVIADADLPPNIIRVPDWNRVLVEARKLLEDRTRPGRL